jgi:hypothetical protein
MKRILIALTLTALLGVAFAAPPPTWKSYTIGQLNGAKAETINLGNFLRGAKSFFVVATVDTFKADVTSIVPKLQVAFPTSRTVAGTDTIAAVQWTDLLFSQAAFGGKDSWYFTGATNAFAGRNTFDTIVALATWPKLHTAHIKARFIFANKAAADTTKAARVTFYRIDE